MAIASLVAGAPVVLPTSYLDQLQISDGGEGELLVDPGWIMFWRTNEVLENNHAYQIAKFTPGLFGFGSNGGGELLAFDTRRGPPHQIVMVPFIPMDFDELVVIAQSFDELRAYIGWTTKE